MSVFRSSNLLVVFVRRAKLQNYRTDVDNLLQSNNGGLPVGPIYEPFFEPILDAAASKPTVGRLKK